MKLLTFSFKPGRGVGGGGDGGRGADGSRGGDGGGGCCSCLAIIRRCNLLDTFL